MRFVAESDGHPEKRWLTLVVHRFQDDKPNRLARIITEERLFLSATKAFS